MIWDYPFYLLPLVAVRRFISYLSLKVWQPIKTWILSRMWKIDCGRNVKFIGKTIIRAYGKGAIKIGNDCVFQSGTENNLVGLMNPTVICAVNGARVQIGNCVGCSSVVIHARKDIQIGNFVNIGGNVRIFDHDFHPVEWESRRHPQDDSAIRVRSIIIEDDVFIGTNAIILKGTRIGARSIVAAGSVVFGLDIPPDSLVKGNPAKIVSRK